MPIDTRAARTCRPGIIQAAYALGLVDGQRGITACLTDDGNTWTAHGLMSCASEQDRHVTTAMRTAAEHAVADEQPCSSCDIEYGWLVNDIDDAAAVEVLDSWARRRMKRSAIAEAQLRGTLADDSTHAWKTGIKYLTGLSRSTGEAVRTVRHAIVEDLAELDAVPGARAGRLRATLRLWTAPHRGTPPNLLRAVPDGIPDLVARHRVALIEAVDTGTDDDVLAWYDRIAEVWVWTHHSVLDDLTATRSVELPDPENLDMGLVKVPAAAEWYLARSTTDPSMCVHVPGVETDADVYAAARLADRDLTKISSYAAALAAART